MDKTLRTSLTDYLNDLRERVTAVELLLEAEQKPGATTKAKQTAVPFRQRADGRPTVTSKVVEVLEKSDVPMTVNQVRLKAGLPASRRGTVDSAVRRLLKFGYVEQAGEGIYVRANGAL